jgi:hypothetical protein
MLALSFLIACALRLVYGRQKRGLGPVEPELLVPACGVGQRHSRYLFRSALCVSLGPCGRTAVSRRTRRD